MHKIMLLSLVLLVQTAKAQYNTVDVLLGQSGQALLDSLVKNYKPQVVLDYDRARDTMFSKIYKFQDSVTCVYTGHKLYLPSNQDPSTAMYSSGSANGINAEHTFPQSKGAASGNARSNLHHLFPARTAANSARNNFPYAEIEDDRTTTWYYKDLAEGTPTFDKKLYSELNIATRVFEPREDHKGNAARAVFYFYAMYKLEADAADPSFFAKMLPTLCQWHTDDPVDSLEWARTYLIANYQEGKINPFVLDCSLPYRTYCPYLPHNSCFTGLNTLADFGIELYENFPNPANQQTTFRYELSEPTTVTLEIYSSTGQLMNFIELENQGVGVFEEELNCKDFPSGLYHYRLIFEQGKGILSIAKNFAVMH